MSLSSSNTNIFPITLDGLVDIEASSIYINGVPIILADLFNKTTDTSDDITEGVNRFASAITASLPLSISSYNITISQSSSTVDGYLSSVDWNIFNGKEHVLTFIGPLSRSTNTISIALATSGT